MTNNRQAMLAEGFDGYQSKPISLKDFLGEIERVLGKSSKLKTELFWVSCEAGLGDYTAEARRARPSTKLRMRAYENSARGELVEPCDLCVSVVNNSPQESWNNQNWKEDAYQEISTRPLRRRADAKLVRENKELRRERDESREEQSATSDILRMIARSPTELQPVLDAIAERAARLCDAEDAAIFRVDGNFFRRAAHFGPIPMADCSGRAPRP